MGITFRTVGVARAAVKRFVPAGGNRAGSLFRISMGGNAIVSWYLAMFEPRSIMHLVAARVEGAALIWLLALVGAAAVVDGLVNDLLPARFHWYIALRQRHFILAFMAFCYVAQLYIAFFQVSSTGLLIYYLWNAITIMAVAFFDANQRSKDASCVIVCS